MPALAVIHCYPVGIELCNAVGATRIERRALLLRDLLHQAIELTGTGLVNACFACKTRILTASRIRACQARHCWRCTPDSQNSPQHGFEPRGYKSHPAAPAE